MNERIRKLAELTLNGKMYAHPTKTEYDSEDLFLSRQQMESKRLCEYILNQQPILTEYSKMTGFFNCDGTVVGDAVVGGNVVSLATVVAGVVVFSVDDWQPTNTGSSSAITRIHAANFFIAFPPIIILYLYIYYTLSTKKSSSTPFSYAFSPLLPHKTAR